MKTEHPTRETLEQFFQGTLDHDAAGRVKRHYEEEGCVRCVLLGRKLMAEAEPERLENFRRFSRRDRYSDEVRFEALDVGFRQAFCRGTLLSGERTVAPDLLAELERRPPAVRRETIRAKERYQLFGLTQHLNDRSRSAVFHDIARALELTELAVEVADHLDPRIYQHAFTMEQRAYARACLGNARRVASDLAGAERSFQEALLLLEHGTGISIMPADVGSLLGSLRINQGRYLEARTVLEEALAAYRWHEFKEDECKTLIKLADVEAYSGNSELAVEILEQAVPLADELGKGRLRLQAHHNLTLWLVDAGQALEAFARYEKARPLYDEQCQEPSLALRRRWLEGRIYSGLGDLDLARTAFEEVRSTAAERALCYEFAVVSLDLALVHLDRGDTARVKDLAEDLAPIFRSYDLHRHALGAIYLFRHAAQHETATTELVREILRYLERSRNNPYARFEPPVRRS